MQEKIRTAVRKAFAGSRKLKITFQPTAIGDIQYLLGMEKSGIIQITESDKMVLEAIAMTNDWDGDRNRVVTITLTDAFEEDWFVGRMSRALDAIEVVA